jgi:hypothetical protein
MTSPSIPAGYNGNENDDVQNEIVLRRPDRVSTRMSFYTIPVRLPNEVLLHILSDWIGSQRISVDEDSSGRNFTLSYLPYENPEADSLITRAADFPPNLVIDYNRIRAQAWLLDTKFFTHPADFYRSHYLLSILGYVPAYTLSESPWSAMQDRVSSLTCHINFPISSATNILPRLSSHHGIEKIHLDFSASQYFALFDVSIPPFHYTDPDTGDNLHSDPLLHGAALFLQHAKEVTLHFGDAYKYAHAWADVQEHGWEDARCRPNVCESGVVIDWILEYAWEKGYLQHLSKLRITGDVQKWVVEKWKGISERHRSYIDDHPNEVIDPFAVHWYAARFGLGFPVVPGCLKRFSLGS